jgi:hypothetical protein
MSVVPLGVDNRSPRSLRTPPDETASTCARFGVEVACCFADHGMQIERMLT